MFRNLYSFAGIQYRGEPGITSSCLQALIELIHAGVNIRRSCLLTVDNSHALLLHTSVYDSIVLKSGFGSGYPGEGSRGLADALYLLDRHCEEIDEFYVEQAFMDRLDASCLLVKDIELLGASQPIRPQRWHEYIYDRYGPGGPENSRLARLFPTSIPFSILDPRLVDLAIRFEAEPDHVILKGYRRLEDQIRSRVGGSNESSSKLMSETFIGKKGAGSPLYWPDMHATEQFGRAQLFIAAFQAFRNHRAHSEKEDHLEDDLREFLILNQLFVLESKAETRKDN